MNADQTGPVHVARSLAITEVNQPLLALPTRRRPSETQHSADGQAGIVVKTTRRTRVLDPAVQAVFLVGVDKFRSHLCTGNRTVIDARHPHAAKVNVGVKELLLAADLRRDRLGIGDATEVPSGLDRCWDGPNKGHIA